MENIATISVEFKVTYTEQQTINFQDDMFRKGWSNSNSQKTGSSVYFQNGSDSSMLSSMKFVKLFAGRKTALDISEEADLDIKHCASSNDILSYTMFTKISQEESIPV